MANQPEISEGVPRPGAADVQCFRYDHLRRLTQAWSQETEACAATPTSGAIGGAAPYWKSYTFHANGSRNTVTDHVTGKVSTYGYASGQSSRVQTVTTGDRVDQYGWDAMGNMTSRTVDGVAQTLEWDAFGKLTEISGRRRHFPDDLRRRREPDRPRRRQR